LPAARFGLAADLPPDLVAAYKPIGIGLVKFAGDDLWRLPIPGRFGIDSAGSVRLAEVGPDDTTRLEIEPTFAARRTAAEALRAHRSGQDRARCPPGPSAQRLRVPATARILRGAAIQIATLESTLNPAPSQKAPT